MTKTLNTTKADEARLHAAEVRRRLMGSPRVNNITAQEPRLMAIAPPVALSRKDTRRFFKDIPLWKLKTTFYNAHVIDYYRWMVEAEEANVRPVAPPSDEPEEGEPRLTMDEIALIVLEDFPDVTLREIKGPRKTRHIILARHITMYRIKQLRPDASYTQMGIWCGRRDHTCPINSIKKIENMIKAGQFKT